MSNQQSHAIHSQEKHSVEEGLKDSGIQERNMSKWTDVERKQSVELTNRQEVLERRAYQSIRNKPEAGLTSSNSTVSPSPPKSYVPTSSPGVTPSQGRYFSPSTPDNTPSPGRYTSPISQDVTPSPTRYASSSTPGVTPSSGRDDTSHSEVETSDSVSLGSLSPERPLRQHCKYCHGESPTRGHVSESSQSESTSSSCHSCASSLKGMGLCSFESDKHNNKQGLYPSRGTSMSSDFFNKNHMGAVVSTINGEVVQDLKGVSPLRQQVHEHDPLVQNRREAESVASETELTPLVQRHLQGLPPQDERNGNAGSFKEKPLSPDSTTVSSSAVPASRPAVPLSPSNSSTIRPRVQLPLPLPPSSSTVPPSSAPVSLPAGPVSPSDSSTVRPRVLSKPSNTSTVPPIRAPVSPPARPVPPSNSSTIRRPVMQQPFLNDLLQWPGQPQHIHPFLANMMASRFQQPGFPRHQLGNPPFLPPSVFNPAMFQGWDGNALLQQQLLASRLPFGLPFHTGVPGIGPRGPVRMPFQGGRAPFGRSDTGSAGRGRPFAPRFPNAGPVNIKTSGNLEKGVPPTPTRSEETPSLNNTSEAQKAPEKDNTFVANDLPKSKPEPSATSTSPENAKFKSASRDSSPRFKSMSDSSFEKSNVKPSLAQSPGSSLTPKGSSSFDVMPKESREETECRGFSPSSQKGRVNMEDSRQDSSPSFTMAKLDNNLESPGVKRISPSKMTQYELRLKEQKVSL